MFFTLILQRIEDSLWHTSTNSCIKYEMDSQKISPKQYMKDSLEDSIMDLLDNFPDDMPENHP